MATQSIIMLGANLAAVLILTLALYYPRHHRRDLVVAFTGVNIGVFAVTIVLGSAEVAMGLGLGLFGVLSIIRLRSSEISQREVAYYFASLAIGLLFGLGNAQLWVPVALAALILTVMAVVDHPAVFASTRHQVINLDRAITNDEELKYTLEQRLGATVRSFSVERLDLVNDTTLVNVCFRVPSTKHPVVPAPPAPLRFTARAQQPASVLTGGA